MKEKLTIGIACVYVAMLCASTTVVRGAELQSVAAPQRDEAAVPAEKLEAMKKKASLAYEQENFSSAASAYEAILSTTQCPQDTAWLHAQLGNCYCRLAKYSQAEPLFKKALARAESDKAIDLQIACLTGLSACTYYRDNYAEAEKLASRALQMCADKATKDYSLAQLELFVAECLYKQTKFDQAASVYDRAIDHCSDDVRTKAAALSGAAACYETLKQRDKAAKDTEQLAAIDRKLYGDMSLEYGWTLERLSQIYKVLGNAKGQSLYEKAIWIYRKANADRLLHDYDLDKTPPEGTSSEELARRQLLHDRIVKLVYGKGYREFSENDAFLADIPLQTTMNRAPSGAWIIETRKTEAPGYVWVDPSTQTRAVLICVHGLGLEHKSFASFAQRIAPEGFVSVAFDVRGFGSYLQSKGREHLDMDGCIDDLRSVAKVLRRDNPDMPLFLLGESMGGAIALRLTAEAPELIDGLICSVPSGSRYKGKRTAFNVALRYIGNKNKPFNVGEGVVKQATTQTNVREEWTNDPEARLRLSPKELLQFQRFMDQNPKYAKLVKSTPTLIFQGDDDKLVKKKGTFDLFEALPSQDKAMILVGHTEHLIFEAGQFRDGLALGVVGWMEAHMPVCQVTPGAKQAKTEAVASP